MQPVVSKRLRKRDENRLVSARAYKRQKSNPQMRAAQSTKSCSRRHRRSIAKRTLCKPPPPPPSPPTSLVLSRFVLFAAIVAVCTLAQTAARARARKIGSEIHATCKMSRATRVATRRKKERKRASKRASARDGGQQKQRANEQQQKEPSLHFLSALFFSSSKRFKSASFLWSFT